MDSADFGRKSQSYKIRLKSGRILGPIDKERISLLISKNQILGTEVAREYPQGEWQNISSFPELVDLFIARAARELKKAGNEQESEEDLRLSNKVDPLAATEVLSSQALPGARVPPAELLLETIPENLNPPEPQENARPSNRASSGASRSSLDQQSGSQEGTQKRAEIGDEEAEKTRIVEKRDAVFAAEDASKEIDPGLGEAVSFPTRQVAQEPTVVFQRSSIRSSLPGKKKMGVRDYLIKGLISIILGILGYQLFLSEPNEPRIVRVAPVRPEIPRLSTGNSDPNASKQAYDEAMKPYLEDTVVGYRRAADQLRKAAELDKNNVKALAMLASSYLNLIDSSNKDENYFSVISKLIDMSSATSVDLAEAVIADVEFYLVANKAEAAQNRIIEYTKTHQNYGPEMFFYLAETFYARGNPMMSARYLNALAENKIFTPKIYYLRGLLAEKLRDDEEALKEYSKALRFNFNHAKSHLKIAEILNKQGALKQATGHLDFLMTHINMLTPSELGKAYYLHGQLAELDQKWDLALGDVERASKLDPENHDYLLELYTLRARSGESILAARQQGRMYYFLQEAEKLVQQGRYQEALVPLLQARQANEESVIPLVKMGDMFIYLHDIENAKTNYKTAAEKDPNNIRVWSKYIQTLIQSYEWDEAKRAMDRFRQMDVSQSAIDKAAADLYQSQNSFVEAQTLYKKAMARDVIDPAVYIAYGKSLMSTKNYKDAPFFFALALRFDPLNIEAIISTAKCVAETESIDRAISALEDELKKGSGGRAEFLSAIAEFQIQKGDKELAQRTLEQAKLANPDYAYPWKLQGQIFLDREGVDRDALDKALLAFQSYSERNSSDPSGYLERFKIFMKKTQFELAKAELAKIYEIYPKYPKLHYYFGRLYAVEGNHRVAAEEYKAELKNNRNSVESFIEYGKELLELGYPQMGLDQFVLAMQLVPNSADAKQNAGWANYKLKHFQAAVTLLQNAIAIDRGNPAIYRRLGIVYRDMGDMASACNSFKKYLEMEPDAADKADFAACF